MHLDKSRNLLQIDLPTADAISTVPAGPAEDIDLLGQRTNHGEALAGAIQHLHKGIQTINVWPLPAVARSTAIAAPSRAETGP
jgi:hypothetical protein